MNIEGWVGTILVNLIKGVPGGQIYLYNRAKRMCEQNPTLFIAQMFENVETMMKLDNSTDAEPEFIEKLATKVCEDLPFILPYRSSLVSFLNNKAAHDILNRGSKLL